MTIIKTLLVGAFAHPPAKLLLQNLPANVELLLCSEPANPYDEFAIAANVETSRVPESRYGELELALPGCGMTLAELLAEPQWQLGYVTASGGRPLAKAGLKQGNREVGELMRQGSCVARLIFWPDGAPGVEIRSNGDE